MVEKHYGHLAPSHVARAIRENLPTFGVNSGGAHDFSVDGKRIATLSR